MLVSALSGDTLGSSEKDLEGGAEHPSSTVLPKRKRRVVILSAYHDYRTRKRASIHQLADGLGRAGFGVTFVSTRFSRLSQRNGDSRLFLWDSANRIETVNGVRCLLWRTSVHPFSSSIGPLDQLMSTAFSIYANLPNALFDAEVSDADYIIVESGVAAIYLRRLRRTNPTAKIIFYGTDRLDTVGVHPCIRDRLVQDHALVDHFALRSPKLARYFDFAPARCYKMSFGVDHQFNDVGPSPYSPGVRTALSIGSMLFDKQFFEIATRRFPDVEFHVIGPGMDLPPAPNLRTYGEMPFAQTLPFVKHASMGLAPYLSVPDADYLADSSLKLAQFEFFGVPAVCPHFAVGSSPARFGYHPSDEQAVCDALTTALARSGQVEPRKFPDWSEVALQLLEPEAYPETWIE